MTERIEMEANCRTCIHEQACETWIRHGVSLYDDYSYTTEDCPDYDPKADVVEVVRCEDCYHWDAEGRGCSLYLAFGEGDFCSYGVRKEGAE